MTQIKRRYSVSYQYEAVDGTWILAHGCAVSPENAVASSVRKVYARTYGPDTYAIIRDRELDVDLLMVAFKGRMLTIEPTDEAMEIMNRPVPLRRVK